jgi:hypothetical protein
MSFYKLGNIYYLKLTTIRLWQKNDTAGYQGMMAQVRVDNRARMCGVI